MGSGHRGVAGAEDKALRGRNLSADTGQIHGQSGLSALHGAAGQPWPASAGMRKIQPPAITGAMKNLNCPAAALRPSSAIFSQRSARAGFLPHS